MYLNILISVISILILKFNCTPLKEELVVQIFRHGHRYSIFSFFNSTHRLGELTPKGEMSSLEKGKLFSENHKELLNTITTVNDSFINKDKIVSFSSKKKRNIVSIFLRLKGMHPELNVFNNFDSDKNNVTEFLEKYFDMTIPNDFVFSFLDAPGCRKVYMERITSSNDYLRTSDEIKKIYHSQKEILDKYLKQLPNGLNFEEKIFFITDYVVCLSENGETLDESDAFLKEFSKKFYKEFIDISINEPSIIRLATSKIYSIILHHLDNVIHNQANTKLVLFSAHDLQLAAFIQSLRLDTKKYNYYFNDEINIMLHKVGKEHFISIKYNEEEVPLYFCSYKNICDYETFKQFLQKSINTDEELRNFCEGHVSDLVNKNVINPNAYNIQDL